MLFQIIVDAEADMALFHPVPMLSWNCAVACLEAATTRIKMPKSNR